jgi:hypothetical protein
MVTRILGICSGVLLSLIVSVIVFPRSATRVSLLCPRSPHGSRRAHSMGRGDQTSQSVVNWLQQEAVKETAKAMKALTELSSQVWAEGIRDALQQNGASAPLAATNGCSLPLPPALNLLHLTLQSMGGSPALEWSCNYSVHTRLVAVIAARHWRQLGWSAAYPMPTRWLRTSSCVRRSSWSCAHGRSTCHRHVHSL